MSTPHARPTIALVIAAILGFGSNVHGAGDGDWTFWRGPHSNGISDAVGLPESWSPKGENLVWKRDDLGTRSTPVVMNGRLYSVCRANPETTREGEKVVCLNAATGETIWETFNNIYLSDAPAERIGWSSVIADPETGKIYVLGLGCLFQCLDGATGEVLWQRSMSEQFGLLSTYGGRTNFPVLFENLIYVSGVSTGFGGDSLPAHRIFAMDKQTGEIVWLMSTRPRPEDTTYSTPIFTRFGNQDAMVLGASDGSVYALQPRTGAVIWKYEVSVRGLNQTPLIVGDRVFCGHSEKNSADTTILGAFFAIDGAKARGEITDADLLWKMPGETIGRSAPLYLDGRIYAVDDGATMLVIDADSGKEVARQRLGRIMFGSPVYGDGKIYLGEATGRFYILKPTETGVEIVHQTRLSNEEILGSPIIADGRIYLPTIGGIYCIGETAGAYPSTAAAPAPAERSVGPATQLRVSPGREMAAPGETVAFEVEAFDADGYPVKLDADVKLAVDGPGSFADGKLTIGPGAADKVLTITATAGTATGEAKLRVVPPLPWRYEFTDGVLPPSWVGMAARHRPIVHEGEPCLVKVSTIPKGTRSQSWFGPDDLHDYTVETDFLATRTDDRLPDMGVVNSRYTLVMLGTGQLQLRSWVSRLEMRFAVTQDFSWQEGVWYRMKFRSEVKEDRIVLLGKVWPRDSAEPEEWTIRGEDLTPNRHGSPGIHGVSSPAEFYIDNITVYPNE